MCVFIEHCCAEPNEAAVSPWKNLLPSLGFLSFVLGESTHDGWVLHAVVCAHESCLDCQAPHILSPSSKVCSTQDRKGRVRCTPCCTPGGASNKKQGMGRRAVTIRHGLAATPHLGQLWLPLSPRLQQHQPAQMPHDGVHRGPEARRAGSGGFRPRP